MSDEYVKKAKAKAEPISLRRQSPMTGAAIGTSTLAVVNAPPRPPGIFKLARLVRQRKRIHSVAKAFRCLQIRGNHG